jgi:hypothetical protein
MEFVVLLVVYPIAWLVFKSADFVSRKSGWPVNFRLMFAVITFWLFALGIPYSIITGSPND